MRDYRKILTDKMIQELLDRWGELGLESVPPAPGRRAGLESMVAPASPRTVSGLDALGGVPRPAAAGITKESVREALTTMQERPPGETVLPGGLEAIILQFGRPAYFVQEDSYDTANTPSSSEEIDAQVNASQTRARILSAIPSVGRIDLSNHRMRWVGTGWLIAPGVVVTNRHVAREFAEPDGKGFAFAENYDGRVAQARLDMYREHQRPKESVFRMPKVLWIEPAKKDHHDVAFLQLAETGDDGQAPPKPIQLMSDAEVAEIGPDRWVAVIGYPAYSIYNDPQDQQRIFQGIYDVKRMQPGQVTTVDPCQLLHDATTLGGNSGSAVVDLETGKVAALHFGGYEGETNYAVTANVVRDVLRVRTGIEV